MIYRELSAGEFNDLASRILYEDNHLLVVNKKVGEIVQGDKTSDELGIESVSMSVEGESLVFSK